MTTNTLSLNEYSEITETCEDESASLRVIGSYSVASSTTDTGICEVVVLDQSRPRENVLPSHVSMDDLEARLKAIPGMDEELGKARPWVAQTLYPDREDLRVLRLSRGLTQSALATLIGSSQPHLARIERGCADVMRDTMRRLCNALQVDMNTLDSALQMSMASKTEAQST